MTPTSTILPLVSCVVRPDLPTAIPSAGGTGTLPIRKYLRTPPLTNTSSRRTRAGQHHPVAQSTKFTAPPAKLIRTNRSRMAI